MDLRRRIGRLEQAVSDAIGGRCSCVDLVPVGCTPEDVGVIQRWRERCSTCGDAPSPTLILTSEDIHAAEHLTRNPPRVSYDEKVATMKADLAGGRI